MSQYIALFFCSVSHKGKTHFNTYTWGQRPKSQSIPSIDSLPNRISPPYQGRKGPRGVVGGTLNGEAPPEMGTFFRLPVYKRVRISQVEIYEKVGKSFI